MQKLILIFSNRLNLYLLESYKGPIAFLYDFLIDIPLQVFPSYIKWGLEEKKDTEETNSTTLQKEPPYILIGSLFSDHKDKGPYFKILIPEFVKVLTEWEKLVNAKLPKITITQFDDGTITIKGE